VLAGLALPCLFMLPKSWDDDQIFWFMLVSGAIYAPIISAYAMPYQSLGAELSPSYHERTRVMSWRACTQKLAGILTGGAFWFATRPMFNDPATGTPDLARGAMWAGAICGAIMILAGVLNFFHVEERYYARAQVQAKVSFVGMLRETFRCKPYLVLLGIGTVYAVPTGLVGTLGYYVTTYYVLGGDVVRSSEVTLWSGVFYGLCGIAGVPVAAGLSHRYGKKLALAVALGTGALAFASSWWMYTPSNPWLSVLCNGANGFSATGLWVLLPSMCVDVVDFDEIRSHQRLEGAFQSTFAWVLKLGMSAAMLVVGPLLDLAGFEAKLGGSQTAETLLWIRILFVGIPVLAVLCALALLQSFPLNEGAMREIRSELEQRRGRI
jgi:GPH family glycoside/pentoside/hexuronide:cation symporter